MSKTAEIESQDAPAAELDGWDFDAWIEDASPPETSVTVVGKGKLKARYDWLKHQIESAQTTYADDDRLADPTADWASEMRAIALEMRDSERSFSFRALSRAEVKAIHSSAPKIEGGESDPEYVAASWLAAASVSPKLTADQFRAVCEHIGDHQYAQLWSAAFGISNSAPNVPFSLAASVALSNKGS